MASRYAKAAKAEAAAYAASVAASAAVIERTLAGIEDAETARLRRRSDAYRVQWLAAARKLEALALAAAA